MSEKIFFIELIKADKTLLNKYKFSLQANTVKQLSQLIKQKLLAKKHIEPDDSLIIRDCNDFELGSDDEVENVVQDGKLSITLADKVLTLPKQVIQPIHTIQSANTAINPGLVGTSNTSSSGTLQAKPLLAIEQPFIKYEVKLPVVVGNSQRIMKIVCPQIRQSTIEVDIGKQVSTFSQLSSKLVQLFGLPAGLKAILYNQYGQPYLYNLDLMNYPLPKLDYSKEYFIIFTATTSKIDSPPPKPMIKADKLENIQVNVGFQKYSLDIDFSNTLQVLKYSLFMLTSIHPQNQTIRFAGNVLVNDLEPLSSYNLKQGSIVQMQFKQFSNIAPAQFCDNFYYKDIQHVHPQSQDSLSSLRSNLMILSKHLSSEHELKFLACLRSYTKNLPLVLAFKLLLNKEFLGQTHRIALEEGLYVALAQYLQTSNKAPKDLICADIFIYVRAFLGYLLAGMEKVDLSKIESDFEFVRLQSKCTFTDAKILEPYLVVLDNNKTVLVDKAMMEEQILKGFTYEQLKKPDKSKLFTNNRLFDAFQSFCCNLIDNPNISTLHWKQEPKFTAVELPGVNHDYNHYENKIDNYPEMKVHQPIEIKNKTSSCLLLKTKEGKFRVYLNKNKDVTKPHNIFNVITGEQQAVNLDLMAGATTTENVEEVIDIKQLKAVITREPKEAIAVLFDISGSMAGKFFNQADLKRIGAVKSFFQAFAYRTVAYNLEHVVSLTFFDNSIENQCGFTEAIYDFNRLVANAAPRGSTRLYDSIVQAVQSLKSLKCTYPNCCLRIIALTDGEDNGSSNTVLTTTQQVIKNQITIDSFAVGSNCEGLKTITLASGGKCYLTRQLGKSLKLFEEETVLSVRTRKMTPANPKKLSIEQLVEQSKLRPFDLPDGVYQFKVPEIKPTGSIQSTLKSLQSEEKSKMVSGSSNLKRIAKEIQNYSVNPHPFVSVYPCQNISLWKILLIGPKGTPYENGVFVLYAQFPGDYPFRAPEVRFITPIYHCNMNAQGRICHSVFDRNYTPALTFRHIIDCVYGLILTPEPEDPLDNVIASFYLSDYPTYLIKAKEETQLKAFPTSEKVVQELFGKIIDDVQRQKKVKEIDEWITKAKSFN